MAYRDPRGGTQPRIWLKNQRPSYPIGAKGYEGSGGNHSYSFENDGMNYVVYMSIIGNTEDDAFIVVAETRTYDSKPAQIISPFSKNIIGNQCKYRPIDNKWLLIISGFDNCESAQEAKKEISFESVLLHSNNYENLNPRWYII